MRAHTHKLMRRRVTRFCLGEDGLTVIELLIVLLVVAALLAIAIPSFLKQPEVAKDSQAQTNLVLAWKAARGQASANDGNYPSAATLASVIPNVEETLLASTGAGFTAASGLGKTQIVIDESSDSDLISLYVESDTGTIWKLTANGSGGASYGEATSVVENFAGGAPVSGFVSFAVAGGSYAHASGEGVIGVSSIGDEAGIQTDPWPTAQAAVVAEVEIASASMTGAAALLFEISSDPGDTFQAMQLRSGTLAIRQTIDSVSKPLSFSREWDASAMRYWRLNEAGGMLAFAYSADGTTWKTLGRVSAGVDVDNARIRVRVETVDPGTATVHIDDLVVR